MIDNSRKRALVSVDDVAGLSRPVTKAIEVIASATGILYEPIRIRRKAKADHDAEIIAAQTRVEITEIERRGLERLIREEGCKQQNIESIMDKAISDISENANPENVDPDWLMAFMDRAKMASSEEVQIIWSKILSGEINSPNTFSKRTLAILGDMSQQEAKLFESACRFFVDGINDLAIWIFESAIYEKFGLNFSTLKSLEDCGLVDVSEMSQFIRKFSKKDTNGSVILTYFDSHVSVDLDLQGEGVPTGQVRLTKSGHDLHSLVSVEPVDGFVDHLLKNLRLYRATLL